MNLKPELVFKYFKEISNIPRPSGHEEKMTEYLKNFGESRNLETIVDEVGNVLIKVPATKGYEDSKTVIVQGHTDMVPEKADDSNHDFLTDPIELIVDGNILHANNTTLGADDGIGVAFGLALIDDKDAEHGPLECLFTISEETTMKGALNLSYKLLTGSYLLNIDSEEEGVMTVGSAGGVNYVGRFSYEPVIVSNDYDVYEINFSGFLGGHSGMMIDKNKGNMIVVMADLVKKLSDAMIVDFDCGTKQNAIPRMGSLTIATKEDIDATIPSIMEKYKDIDGNLEITYSKTSAETAMSTIDSEAFSNYLLSVPTGENSYMDSEKTILESSSNLAIVTKLDNSYEITVSVRSAKEERKKELEDKLELASKTFNVDYKYSEGYPTWVYREDSELRDHAMDLYKKLYNKEMKVEVTHGGLECGVFYEKYRDLDMISIGPNISGAHTPKESLEIDSTERVYEFVKELLKSLK
ncbi:aminoacyl-histidine dipeptidase [Peptoniphilus sp.]|uniref:aminoacyl-histidine dipeptidase n=1 Tax=Peptoniphilus sp. TaxID=1971214 RepID=UPI0039919D17